MRSSLDLTMRPAWKEIEGVRIETANFLLDQKIPDDAVQAVTMVVSELVENSVKYGIFASPESQVSITVKTYGDMIIAEVANPVDDSVIRHLKELDKTLQWIRGFQDPFQAYAERIVQISKKPLDDKFNGLGLVRIAYEGNAILDFFLSEDNLLNVSAVSNL